MQLKNIFKYLKIYQLQSIFTVESEKIDQVLLQAAKL
jgi:hypothetical protein